MLLSDKLHHPEVQLWQKHAGRQQGGEWRTSPEDTLGREQWEGMPQVEAHLLAKQGMGPCACAIWTHCPVLDHIRHKVEILHTGTHQSGLKHPPSNITQQQFITQNNLFVSGFKI